MANTSIILHKKTFVPYLSSSEIAERVQTIGLEINDLKLDPKNTAIVSVLNGSFMFTSDVCKYLDFNSIVSFIKVSSYQGTKSQGSVTSVLGLDFEVAGKSIIIIEDIVDTGNTIEYLYNHFIQLQAKEIFIVCLLYKPESYKKTIPINFKGFNIPNDFVVGYGLDYDGLGRNLKEIYVLK